MPVLRPWERNESTRSAGSGCIYREWECRGWEWARCKACVLCECTTNLLPGVEVQRGELAEVGVGHEDVEGLALVDVRAAVGRHVDEVALLDLPHRLVQRLELLGDVEVGDAAVGGNLRKAGGRGQMRGQQVVRMQEPCPCKQMESSDRKEKGEPHCPAGPSPAPVRPPPLSPARS